MIIREMKKEEIPLLEEFIYQAIFQKNIDDKVPRSIVNDPSVFIYIKDFGKYFDDSCLVAEQDNIIIGSVWIRLLNGTPKGFGNVDNTTPEFAISVLPQYRNMGIGTKLMKAMLDCMKVKGYKKASLAVQKENYAVEMYKQVGFEIINENSEEYIMVVELD